MSNGIKTFNSRQNRFPQKVRRGVIFERRPHFNPPANFQSATRHVSAMSLPDRGPDRKVARTHAESFPVFPIHLRAPDFPIYESHSSGPDAAHTLARTLFVFPETGIRQSSHSMLILAGRSATQSGYGRLRRTIRVLLKTNCFYAPYVASVQPHSKRRPLLPNMNQLKSAVVYIL